MYRVVSLGLVVVHVEAKPTYCSENELSKEVGIACVQITDTDGFNRGCSRTDFCPAEHQIGVQGEGVWHVTL